MKNLIIIVMVFLCITTLCAQNNDSVNNDSITLDPEVRYGKLENGFTYYLHPNSSTKGQIESHLIFKTGTWYEDENQREYAHLLEHMGGKSTENFPDVRGFFGQKGAYPDASIDPNYTDYSLRMPAENKQLLIDAFHYMRDLTNNISLNQESIDVERGAVLGEGRNIDPHRWWRNHVVAKNQAVKNTNYAIKLFDNSNPEVQDKMIRNFDRESFVRFYRDWYRPGIEGLTVVGDFNVDSVEVQVREIFSTLAKHKNPRSSQGKVLGRLQLGGENQYDKVLDTIETTLQMLFTSKSPDYSAYTTSTRSDYRQILVQDVYKSIINKRSKVFTNSYDSPISYFSLQENDLMELAKLTVQFGSDEPAYIQDRFMHALILWKRLHTGITQSDLDMAKGEILKTYENQGQDNSNLSTRYINHFVMNIAAPGARRESAIVAELLEEIELSEILSYAKKMEDLESNKDFLFFKGPGVKVPDFASVRKWVEEADATTVSALDPPKPPIESLKDGFNPPTVNMEDFKISENEIGVARVELANNIQLILKPTAPSSKGFANSVNVLAYISPGITYRYDSHHYAASALAPEIVQFAGAGEYTKFELSDFMVNKKMRVHLQADAFSQTILGSSKIEDIEKLFGLFNLYVTAPRKDKVAFKVWKKQKQEKMAGTWGRTNSAFYRDSILVRQYPGLPTYTSADIAALEMEEAYNAFAENFAGFDGYTFIITGDFEINELAPKIIQYISALPVTGKKLTETAPMPEFDLKKKNEKIEIGNANQVSVQLSFPFLAKKDLKSEIIYKLLGDALKERIFNKLREGCYSPTAYGSWIDKVNGIYVFNIRFDSELGYENKLIRYAKEEFRKLRDLGVEEDWLQNTINNKKRAYSNRIERSGYLSFWEGYIQDKVENKEPLSAEVLQFEAILDHFISIEDVNEAAKRDLSEENLQQFLIVPRGYEPGI